MTRINLSSTRPHIERLLAITENHPNRPAVGRWTRRLVRSNYRVAEKWIPLIRGHLLSLLLTELPDGSQDAIMSAHEFVAMAHVPCKA